MGLAKDGHDATFKLINPKKEPLTIEKLRTFKGFEDMSDEEVNMYIDTIDRYLRIVLDVRGKLIEEYGNGDVIFDIM